MPGRSLPLAIAVGLLPFTAIASTPDVIETYVRSRASVETSPERFQDTPAFLAAFLAQPASPYSELIDTPTDINELWWIDFTSELLGRDGDSEAALALLQKAAGLTKARPGIDVTVSTEDIATYRGAEAAAAAIKAGIDPDIYGKALDLNHPRITAAAGQAVALQILREHIRRYDADEREARGIRADVFARVMSAPNKYSVREDDDRYLGSLLRMAVEQPYTQGDALPTVYRVARTAASYKDRTGYFGSPLCTGSGAAQHMPTNYVDALADHRPLCFMAATDRAVHAWFREELRLEASGERIHENHHEGWARLLHWLGAVLTLADMASLLEFTNAAIAGDLVETGALAVEDGEAIAERNSHLICKAHIP